MSAGQATSPAMSADVQPLLKVVDAVKHFPAGRGEYIKAVDGVSFEIKAGETLGLLGESGCGKSTLAKLVSQLIPLTSGQVIFEGVDLTQLRAERLRQVRRNLQVIFQDPYSSLNPRMTVGNIISEPLENYARLTRKDKDEHVQELLRLVGLNPNFNNRYPHEFSGGQRQRIGIARALALRPKLIVCDEPVSALDTSIQAQIINLLEDLQEKLDLTYLFIAHDLSVVRHISDRIMVMYLGKIVELSPAESIEYSSYHPYTRALISAIPSTDATVAVNRSLVELKGEIPSARRPPAGCRFHTRCPIAVVPGICADIEPLLEEKAVGQLAACHFSEKLPAGVLSGHREG